jgi:hypothetical protein
MASSGILRRVALVRTDVSEERFSSIIRITRSSVLGTTLAVTSNRRTPILHESSWGVRLTTSPPSLCPLYSKCGSLDSFKAYDRYKLTFSSYSWRDIIYGLPDTNLDPVECDLYCFHSETKKYLHHLLLGFVMLITHTTTQTCIWMLINSYMVGVDINAWMQETARKTQA